MQLVEIDGEDGDWGTDFEAKGWEGGERFGAGEEIVEAEGEGGEGEGEECGRSDGDVDLRGGGG